MPIVVHLDRLLYERELTLTDLSLRVGVTVVNLSILKTNKARAVRFSTLEGICRELDCQPGELLAYVASRDQPTGELGDREQAGRWRPAPPGDDRRRGR